MRFKKVKLRDISTYVSERIETEKVNLDNYISTENLIANKGGKRKAAKLPSSKTVIRYKPKDILISNIRPYFKKIWFSNKSGGSSADVLVIRANERVVPKYLYYFLSQDKIFDYMVQTSKGTKMPRGDKQALMKYELIIPSLKEQKKVSSFLFNIDRKIEINNSIISNLEELAQTLFKRWFVDFEFPNEEGKPYKSSGGKMVESELGMMPKDWEIKQLNEIVKHSKKSFNPNKEEQVHVAHFSFPAYDSQRYPIVEDSKTIKSNKYYIDENSIMFSRMNPKTPRTWLPNIQSKYINVCSSEYVVLDTSLYANKGYIFSLISSNEFNNYLINNATGSTNSRQRVRPEVALQYAFAFDENVAKEFEQKIGSFYKEITSLREEIFTLSNLRDTLLPKLLSGEIELPDDMEVTDDVPIS